MSEEPVHPESGAPRLMDAAIVEARSRGHEFVGTGHLALALLVIADGAGRAALARAGVDASALRRAMDEALRTRSEFTPRTAGGGGARSRLPLTPNAKAAFELALSAARSEGSERLDARHVLIGLARISRGVAAAALASLGIDATRLAADHA